MESALITFKDKNNPEKEINIELLYNKEDSSLDYNLKLSDVYSNNTPMDFIGFLADMFLKSLQIQD